MPSKISFLWNRIPIIIRSVLLGLLISSVGVMTWTLLATVIPMPYSFILMAILLWLFWKYFTGSWKPETTQQFRRENTRSRLLDRRAWLYAAAGIILIVLIEQLGLAVTFRITAFPAEQFRAEYLFLSEVPPWAGWMVIIMISAVAAVCEEVGFRGYMQVPLEGKYGAVASISIVSVVFVLMHLHQAWSGPIVLQIFFISSLFGSIAYFSGSLIPGIIAHFVMDVCNFSFWWSDLGKQFSREPIHASGMDLHFIVSLTVLLVSILTFVIVMRRLGNLSGMTLRVRGESQR